MVILVLLFLWGGGTVRGKFDEKSRSGKFSSVTGCMGCIEPEEGIKEVRLSYLLPLLS